MAGHSHWKQVKHHKGVTDAKRGQLFSKLVKEITVAAREGGANPESNARLRTAIERGKQEGLPKDNIERARERAAGKGAEGELFEFLYEAAAPNGATILIEGITDNKNRTLAEIRRLLGERGARLAEQGSLSWNFEKIGTLVCRMHEASGISKEEAETAIIESGATDFREQDDAWLVETPFAERERVREKLERHGIAVVEAGHDYKPKAGIRLAPDTQAAIEPLLSALTEHEDVQDVYTNMAVGGEI